jgi:RNA polymerase sigma-70 factor (ECF subfamily)
LHVQPPRNGQFPTTHWTLVERIRSPDTAIVDRALNDLCGQYHYPLYCYIRRRGHDHHDAQDILHDFFAKLLRLNSLGGTTAEKGRLRGFLCAALQHFLINWHRDHREQQTEVSMDGLDQLAKAEERYLREQLTDQDTPDRLFARKWAQQLLTRVLLRLRDDYLARGKEALFTALKPVLISGGSLRDENSAKLASSLGMTGAALRKALERMLDDYRELLEEEVGQTVDEPAEVEEEINELQNVFRQRS